jgi:hypothetical protein
MLHWMGVTPPGLDTDRRRRGQSMFGTGTGVSVVFAVLCFEMDAVGANAKQGDGSRPRELVPILVCPSRIRVCGCGLASPR